MTDAVGSQIMPKGGANTGFGGTAPHPAASPAPWLLTIAFGTVLTGVAFTGLRRTRPHRLATDGNIEADLAMAVLAPARRSIPPDDQAR